MICSHSEEIAQKIAGQLVLNLTARWRLTQTTGDLVDSSLFTRCIIGGLGGRGQLRHRLWWGDPSFSAYCALAGFMTVLLFSLTILCGLALAEQPSRAFRFVQCRRSTPRTSTSSGYLDSMASVGLPASAAHEPGYFAGYIQARDVGESILGAP